MTFLFDSRRRRPCLELLLIIFLALVMSLLLTLVIGNLKAAAQTKIGPWVGLRIPIYDYACKCYRYFKLNPDQFQIDPDPAGTSDGIWSVKLLAAPGTNPIPVWRREDLSTTMGIREWMLSQVPIPGTVELWINGVSSKQSDYSVEGKTLRLAFEPPWYSPTSHQAWVTYFHVP